MEEVAINVVKSYCTVLMGSFKAPLLVKEEIFDLSSVFSFKFFGINLKTPMDETGLSQVKSEGFTIRLSSLGMLELEEA